MRVFLHHPRDHHDVYSRSHYAITVRHYLYDLLLLSKQHCEVRLNVSLASVIHSVTEILTSWSRFADAADADGMQEHKIPPFAVIMCVKAKENRRLYVVDHLGSDFAFLSFESARRMRSP
jgi:hypothetical protein